MRRTNMIRTSNGFDEIFFSVVESDTLVQALEQMMFLQNVIYAVIPLQVIIISFEDLPNELPNRLQLVFPR